MTQTDGTAVLFSETIAKLLTYKVIGLNKKDEVISIYRIVRVRAKTSGRFQADGQILLEPPQVEQKEEWAMETLITEAGRKTEEDWILPVYSLRAASLIPSCRGSALPCLVGENQHLRSCDGGVILSGPEETLSESSEELPLFGESDKCSCHFCTMDDAQNSTSATKRGKRCQCSSEDDWSHKDTKREDEGRPLSTPWWTYIRIPAPTPVLPSADSRPKFASTLDLLLRCFASVVLVKKYNREEKTKRPSLGPQMFQKENL